MLLIPAIDLKDGQCVRLRQGVMESATVYSSDPAQMARHWAELGARRLHVVDLDGAFAGAPVNRQQVAAIVEAVPEVPVQIGGGIRTLDTAEAYLQAGAEQVIVGTRAVEDLGFLRQLATSLYGRVMLGLDARDGQVATRGWTRTRDIDVQTFAGELADIDLFAIVYTDIGRDGMLSGVNAAAAKRLAETVAVPVIASGGVRSLEDLQTLKALDLGADHLLGAISGAALYEGTLDFAAGQQLLDA